MTKKERIEKMKADFDRMKGTDEAFRQHGYKGAAVNCIAGMDEVGRGPLAGPVVTAAVILPRDFDVLGVNDSKKLTEKRREELYTKIKAEALDINIGMRDNREIDRINILNATKAAMKDAAEGLEIRPDLLLIDALTIDTDIPQEGIVKGDSKSLSIAAASIVAKVTRDHMMIDYAEEFPGYAFEKNKGYGTRAHYAGLDALGPCPIHRQSFLVKYFERKE